MKVVILESCRSPEIKKETEALILSNFFTQHGIDYELYSNDGSWQERVIVDKDLLKYCLKKLDVGIVHLAMHGSYDGFVLKWSGDETTSKRVPQELLTNSDIRAISEWRGKLVVSGACCSAGLASSFLDAGATGVVAPENLIPWTNLGKFFSLFYKALFLGQNAAEALSVAISQFPEFKNYHLYSASELYYLGCDNHQNRKPD